MNLILFDEAGEIYHLTGDDSRHRHIRTVLRAQPGDTVRIGIIQGPQGKGTIESVTPSETVIRAEWFGQPQKPWPLDVIVGHPRPPVLQRLWRDLTTARVRSIHVFAGDLGEPNYLASSVWSKLDDRLREGMSQGRHTCRPDVHRYKTLDDVLKAPFAEGTSETHRLYGGVDGPAIPLVNCLARLAGEAVTSVCVSAGPERGFSPREILLLQEHRYRAVSLGTSVFRTETAVHGLVIPLVSILCGFTEDHI